MTHRESSYDPLLSCLTVFSRLYNRPVSIEALTAGLPVEPGALGPELFSPEKSRGMFQRVAKRAGFVSRLVERPLPEISSLLLPCILVLKGRRACILDEIDLTASRARIVLPDIDDGFDWVDLAKLEKDYAGFVFLLKQEYHQNISERRTFDHKSEHWFWGTLARSKDAFVSVIIASLLINVFVVAVPLFTMNVYDRVVPNNALSTLWVLATGVFVIFLFDAALRLMRTYFLEVAGKKSDVIMSSILFEQVLNIRLSSWPKSVGAFASNLREFESIRNFFSASTLSALVDLPFCVFLLALVAFIGGPVVFIPIVVIGLLLVYGFSIMKPLRKSIEATMEAFSSKNAHLVESLHNIQTLKAMGASSHAQWVWEEASGEIAEKSMRSRLLSNSIAVVTQFFIQLNTVGVIVFGVYLISEQALSLGGLIAVVMLSSRAVAPMAQVATLISQYQQTRAAFEALDRVMEMPVERLENKPYVRRPAFNGLVAFEHVGFQYPDSEKAALSDISIKIHPGEHVGIIGKVGSGKSTLAKLLAGLYQPAEGSISLDGINLNQIDPADLRRHITYLPQDVQLLRGTIRDNLLYRDPQASDERMLEVAAISGVDLFVNQMPAGYDTQVGEQGAFLSGGQRQSIALGRSLLLDESLIVLDEPTSNMDNTSEYQIRKRLLEYTRSRTLLLVTHKMSMLELVERLVVVEGGRVIIDGPKAEVIAFLKKTGR